MNIKLFLDVNNFNGGPTVRVLNKDKEIYSATLCDRGPTTLEFNIPMTLPNILVIEHIGKDMKRDTLLLDGKITNDKGFTIKAVQLNDLTLRNELYMFDFIKDNGDTLKNNNYIGFNGKFVIDIDNTNLADWHSGWQKLLVTEQQDFSYDDFRNEIFGMETSKEILEY